MYGRSWYRSREVSASTYALEPHSQGWNDSVQLSCTLSNRKLLRFRHLEDRVHETADPAASPAKVSPRGLTHHRKVSSKLLLQVLADAGHAGKQVLHRLRLPCACGAMPQGSCQEATSEQRSGQ